MYFNGFIHSYIIVFIVVTNDIVVFELLINYCCLLNIIKVRLFRVITSFDRTTRNMPVLHQQVGRRTINFNCIINFCNNWSRSRDGRFFDRAGRARSKPQSVCEWILCILNIILILGFHIFYEGMTKTTY